MVVMFAIIPINKMSQVAYMDVPERHMQDHFPEVHKLTETIITEEDEVCY